MDLFEESRDDRLMEDYLFSGYKPHNQKTTFDADHQFARPIEDEDLFCVKEADIGAIPSETIGDVLEPSSNQFDFDDRPFRRLSDEPICDTNVASPGKIFEDEASDPLSPPTTNSQEAEVLPDAPLDDIFLDDYSESGDATNNENIRPSLVKSYSKPPAAPQLTPAQIRKKLMTERIRQNAMAMKIKPISSKPLDKIGAGFGKDGTIEVDLEHCKLVSDSSSKFIFNKLFNKSNKANDGSPKCDKMNWSAYKTQLRKQICAQKRKVWDSFQAPVDAYDEEEELVGTESIQGSPRADQEKEDGPNEQNQAGADEDDGADVESNADDDGEDDNGDDDSGGSESQASSENEADISDADLDDQDESDGDHESDKSKMDCDQESESESDDEIVRRKVIIETDDDDDEDGSGDAVNDAGSVRNFIDDEVEVDEELY